MIPGVFVELGWFGYEPRAFVWIIPQKTLVVYRKMALKKMEANNLVVY